MRRNGLRDRPERFNSNEIVQVRLWPPLSHINLSPSRLQLLVLSNLPMKVTFASNFMVDLTGEFLRRVMGGCIAQAALMMDEEFTRRCVLRPVDVKGFQRA